MASVAVCSAVSNPKVSSVADRSLSIVFGTPTIFRPLRKSSCPIFCEPSPPMVMIASMPSFCELAMTSSGDVAHHLLPIFAEFVTERIAAIRGAQNRAAARQNSAHLVERQLERFFRPDQPVEAVGNADDFPVVFQDGRSVAARITALRPGASPPPVAMPMQRISDMKVRWSSHDHKGTAGKRTTLPLGMKLARKDTRHESKKSKGPLLANDARNGAPCGLNSS